MIYRYTLHVLQALLLTFSFAFFNGLIASWFCVMDITFQDLPIADTEDMVRWKHKPIFRIILYIFLVYN